MCAECGQFDKEEWRAVAKLLRPDWTEEQYETEWAEFHEMKRQHFIHLVKAS